MLHWGLRQKNISMSSAPPTWKVRPRSSQRLAQVTQQVREVGPGPGSEGGKGASKGSPKLERRGHLSHPEKGLGHKLPHPVDCLWSLSEWMVSGGHGKGPRDIGNHELRSQVPAVLLTLGRSLTFFGPHFLQL